MAADCVLLALLNLLLRGGRLMKLRFEYLVGLLTDGLFDKPAGVTAFTTREALGFHSRLTIGGDGDFNNLQATPPTRIVSLMEPSLSGCSYTV